MAITAVEIESNGWVLAISVTGSLTSPATNFGAYTMSPDASPRVDFSVSSPGFVKNAGTAVAGSTSRPIVGLRPLRKAVDPLNPSNVVLDETDLGGGVIKVRIALSEEVYSTDTVGTLSVLSGWRTGESAASAISITNNSTVAAPAPVMRWVLPPYDTTTGTFRVSLIVGSVHPVGFEPVAGVKFTATDGTNVKTVWTTSLGFDNTYGDNLRCYTVQIDPSTATALTQGLLRIDAEVYPWVGVMRTTDPAGTKTMTGMNSLGVSQSAESPWVIGYDPAGTLYGQVWTYVDPVNGTLTSSAAMVATTLAAAKAIAPASRPKTISTAISAIALQNRTFPAANGQGSITRCGEGAKVVLAPGTHVGANGTSVNSGFSIVSIPVYVMGDPDDSNPRANCIIESSGTAAVTRAGRIRWRNLTVLGTTASINDSGTLYNFLDNIELRAKSGSESNGTSVIASGAPPAGTANWYVTNTKYWRTNYNLTTSNRFVGLLRASQISRRSGGQCIVKNRWIGKVEDGFTTANTIEGFATNPQSTNLGGLEDFVVAYNDVRYLRWTAVNGASAPAAISGVSPQITRFRRHLIMNNVFERISTTNGVTPDTDDSFLIYGESSYCVMDTIIIEGNTFAGAKYNAFYNDPVPVTLTDVNTMNSLAVRIRHANNAADRNASKQDDFSDGTTNAIRVAAGGGEPAKQGYRPVLTDCWSVHYGCGMEGHVDFGRKGTISVFRREFSGLRGIQYGTPTTPGWTNDRSEAGNDLGGGDYTPTASSPLLNRIKRANSDVDFAGNFRVVNGASGAIEASGVFLTLTGGDVTASGTWALAPTVALQWSDGDVTVGSVWALGAATATFSGPRRFVSSGLRGSQLSTFAGTVIR
jgi:hypothetical protein